MAQRCDDTRHHTLLHVDHNEVAEQTENSCCDEVEGLTEVKGRDFP